jgi:RNA polymerase sigma-70 factor (ECF subfamily)
MQDAPRSLLERARGGDGLAYDEFVRLHERRVRAVLGRLLADERDVEEAVQDTFVQAWRHLDRFRGDARPFTWLYRIAVNEALQRRRRRRLETRPLHELDEREIAAARDPTAGRRSAEAVAAEHQELAFVAERVRALPFELRGPLVLRDLEDWPYEEIAKALDISLAAVRSRTHRARMRIRAEREAWLRRPQP